MATKTFKPDDVAAGRAYIKVYVEFIHFVERLYDSAMKAPHGHLEEREAPRNTIKRGSHDGSWHRERCSSDCSAEQPADRGRREHCQNSPNGDSRRADKYGRTAIRAAIAPSDTRHNNETAETRGERGPGCEEDRQYR